MHYSAYQFGSIFFDNYYKHGMKVVEIGSQNVNGSLKDALAEIDTDLDYTGVDFVSGNGVDVILDDPYQLPFADESFDMLVSSSCFEHSELFWLSFLEMLRVLKPEGVLYLNVPNNGWVHRYPVDCWRFYPDAGKALETWGNRNNISVQLVESFVGKQLSTKEHKPELFGKESGRWNDFVAVFVKEQQHLSLYPNRMFNDQRSLYTSLRHEAEDITLKLSEKTEDFLIQDQQSQEYQTAVRELVDKNKIIIEIEKKATQQSKQIEQLFNDKNELTYLLNREKQKNSELLNSTIWRCTKPVRIFLTYVKKVFSL